MLYIRSATRSLRPSLSGIPLPRHLPASLPALVSGCPRQHSNSQSRPKGITYATSAMTLGSAKIIGDVIDAVRPSSVKLDIKYSYDHVENGVTISPTHAHSAPAVTLSGADPSKLYTLLMSDPDPPDPAAPKMREWLHWMVENIPGGDAVKVDTGHTVVAYNGPAPPVGTHRYVFLLFEQPSQEPLQLEDPSKGEKMGRAHFNTRKWAKEHGLGDPVAAKFFLSHK